MGAEATRANGTRDTVIIAQGRDLVRASSARHRAKTGGGNRLVLLHALSCGAAEIGLGQKGGAMTATAVNRGPSHHDRRVESALFGTEPGQHYITKLIQSWGVDTGADLDNRNGNAEATYFRLVSVAAC